MNLLSYNFHGRKRNTFINAPRMPVDEFSTSRVNLPTFHLKIECSPVLVQISAYLVAFLIAGINLTDRHTFNTRTFIMPHLLNGVLFLLLKNFFYQETKTSGKIFKKNFFVILVIITLYEIFLFIIYCKVE